MPPPGAPEPQECAYLLVLGGHSASRVSLPPSGEVLIGRAPEVQLCLPEPSISRHHARLVVAEGEIRIEDLGSHNGTRVDGERIRGPRTLLLGDVITLGDVTLVLHREAVPAFRPIEDELRELERARMLQALAAAGGVHRRAAELIGMPRRTFATKFKLYELASTTLAKRSG